MTSKAWLVEWTNPHARIYVDVENDSGGVDNFEERIGSGGER